MKTDHNFAAGVRKDIRQLMRVALAREVSDLAVVNGRLLNVYTGEVLDQMAVCTKGPWIAYIGTDTTDKIGPQTTVIDAAGKMIIPGLIDGHTHLAWLGGIAASLEPLMAGGTTALVTESLEVYPVSGLAGVNDFLDALSDQPIKIFATAPFMASISREAQGIDLADLNDLLSRPEIVGLGESYWQAVLQNPESAAPVLEVALSSGKTLEGHTAGARGNKLAAYLAAGISSCHEPTTAAEALERLRLGLHVMLREGSIRRDLDALASIKDAGVDTRRLILVTDGLTPRDLIEKGGMDFVVRKAIDRGFDPIVAVQMATLNVAEHFRLDGLIGGIAPGRSADMLIVPDLKEFRPEIVISNGKIIATQGRVQHKPRRPRYLPASLSSVLLPDDVTPADFQIVAQDTDSVKVRVIEMVTDLVTTESHLDLLPVDDRLTADPERDLVKVAAIDRTHFPGKRFVGLLKGFGLKTGAMACSAAWDTSDIIVVGTTDGDMAAAVNRIRELQGGAVVVEDGAIAAELPLPVFGLMSEESLERVARKLAAVNAAANRLGCPFPDPLLTLVTLTGAAIPYLRICEEGLVNLKNGETMGLFVDHRADAGNAG
ncbi:MAG: adenine deaminase C-terminal domain-containing protein [Desulfobacterales bacterium]